MKTKEIEFRKKKCRLCGFSAIYTEENLIEECPACKNHYDKTKFLFVEMPEGDTNTHNQIRWGCASCAHFGIVWQKKQTKICECPNPDCNAGSDRLRLSKVQPEGDCNTIWKPILGIKRRLIKTNFSKKKHICTNCGYTTRYLIKHVTKCTCCGRYH